MIASISLMRRQDQVSLGRFRRHWLDVHGPLVCAFPGLRAYAQCHPIASAVMNERARRMRIDGFPILFFDNDTDRLKAHGSPEMAACNVDSRLFVGAVSRVIVDVETVVSTESGTGRVSVLMLYPAGTAAGTADADQANMLLRPGLRALARYHVREQGAAPASTVPHLGVNVADAMQARFDSVVDLECAMEDWDAVGSPGAALFVTEEHWQV